jgi:hypothetical protein
MATREITYLIDDLDGGDAEESILFGLDGVQYEIDLSGKNAEQLRKALARYRDAARRLKGSTGSNGAGTRMAPTNGNGSRPAQHRTQLPDVRPSWDGLERKAMQKFAAADPELPDVADRGRISRKVSDAWIAAGRPR